MKFYEDLEQAMKHLSDKGAFLSVEGGGKKNCMTISWGFIGFIWNKPHFITLVRPQRYTRELLEAADSFTISIPYGSLSEELKICGSKSGRDIDKSKVVSFAAAKEVSSPIVSGCQMYYECKIKYVDAFHKEKLPMDAAAMYKNEDYHDLFIGEIVEAYRG